MIGSMIAEETKTYYFTQTLTIAALIGAIYLGLLPALLGGLIVYFLVEFGARMLGLIGVLPAMGRLILLIVIALVVVTAITFGIVSVTPYISEGPESFVVLLQKMADVVHSGRNYIPEWALQHLPSSIDEWQSATAAWLRENALHYSVYGKEAGVLLIHIIFGMIIGGMIAIKPAFQEMHGPLAASIRERINFLSSAFRRVVFSQIRISALNTLLTGIFLLVVLPLTGNHLPFAKMLVAVTFVTGLIPIIGNIMSNTIIFLIALSVSPIAAVGSLLYLIFIHKLEYFFNAHIIGSQINARAWEILLAMLVMESVFGIAGLIAAPIYYAYIKAELTAQRLI